jgi:hypothetical protein
MTAHNSMTAWTVGRGLNSLLKIGETPKEAELIY